MRKVMKQSLYRTEIGKQKGKKGKKIPGSAANPGTLTVLLTADMTFIFITED